MATQHTVDVLLWVRNPLGTPILGVFRLKPLIIAFSLKKEGDYDFKILRVQPKSVGIVSELERIVTTRTCTKCGEEKDISEFSWSIRGVKRHSRCKKCHAEEKKDYYKRNKEKMLIYKWDRQIRKREEARQFVINYLSTHPCVDCGERDPLVLTFDHVRGKKKTNVAELVNRGYLVEVIQEEIEKCEVRCANCHMRKEKERRGTKYF